MQGKCIANELKMELTSLVQTLGLLLYQIHRIVTDLTALWNRSQ